VRVRVAPTLAPTRTRALTLPLPLALSKRMPRPTGVLSRNQSIQPTLRLRGLVAPLIASTAVATCSGLGEG